MQKKKSGVKKCLEICAIKGGVGRLMANTILNFHFDYPQPSLSHHIVWLALAVMTSITIFKMVIQVRALQEEKLEEFFQLAIARFGQSVF